MEVGFEQPLYNVVEGVGQFNVCVVVTVPPNTVPLERTFFLSVSTRPDTAGMYMYVSQPRHNIHSLSDNFISGAFEEFSAY